MAFTKEQREKAIATRKANAEKRRAKEAIAEVASVKHASAKGTAGSGGSADSVARLEAEIERLRSELGVEKKARSEAEAAALASAEAQGMLMQTTIVEVPTRKTKAVSRLDRYESKGWSEALGREILTPIWKKVSLPTFFYKVDLPPCGGLDLKINGMPLYHGAVYELDVDTLRTVKEIVFRCWKHDADIHKSDENAYRKPTHQVLSARAFG